MRRKRETQRQSHIPPWLSEILPTLQEQEKHLDRILVLLEKIRREVPLPEPGELQEMQERTRPLTPEAYVLGLLQETILDLENAWTRLQIGLDNRSFRELRTRSPSEIELNAVKAAIVEIGG